MNVLKQALRQRRLTMDKAAKEIGLSRSTLHRWSRGASVDSDSQERIEAWLGTTYDQEALSSIDSLLAGLLPDQEKRNLVLALIQSLRS